jgi:hypothetical protein
MLRTYGAALVIEMVMSLTPSEIGGEKLQAPIYKGAEGWRIALVGNVDWERAKKIAEGMEILQQGGDWPGAGKLVKLQAREGGQWVICEALDLGNCRLEIWKDTRMIVTLKSGEEVRSLAIVATADPMQTVLLDNRVVPFVVTDAAVHGRRGPPQLHVKLDGPARLGTVASIRFEGIVAKCD